MTNDIPNGSAARKRQIEQKIAPLLHPDGGAKFAAGIMHGTHPDNQQTLLFTSCHDREGKTLAAVNVAYALALEAKKRVLLIDANRHDGGDQQADDCFPLTHGLVLLISQFLLTKRATLPKLR